MVSDRKLGSVANARVWKSAGARQIDVLQLHLGLVLKLVVAGIAGGAGTALALSSSIQARVFRIPPSDQARIAGIALAMLAETLVAVVLRAWRAVRIELLEAVRGDWRNDQAFQRCPLWSWPSLASRWLQVLAAACCVPLRFGVQRRAGISLRFHPAFQRCR